MIKVKRKSNESLNYSLHGRDALVGQLTIARQMLGIVDSEYKLIVSTPEAKYVIRNLLHDFVARTVKSLEITNDES